MSDKTTLQKGQVLELVERVIRMVAEKHVVEQQVLKVELDNLHLIITQMLRDLHSIYPGMISSKHVPSATGELDAVKAMNEKAANKIIGSAEIILEKSAQLDPEFNRLFVQCANDILEACSFQDLAGQRITRILNALDIIDKKSVEVIKMIEHRLAYFAGLDSIDPSELEAGQKIYSFGKYKSGVQLDQDDIDKLLSDLS